MSFKIKDKVLTPEGITGIISSIDGDRIAVNTTSWDGQKPEVFLKEELRKFNLEEIREIFRSALVESSPSAACILLGSILDVAVATEMLEQQKIPHIPLCKDLTLQRSIESFLFDDPIGDLNLCIYFRTCDQAVQARHSLIKEFNIKAEVHFIPKTIPKTDLMHALMQLLFNFEIKNKDYNEIMRLSNTEFSIFQETEECFNEVFSSRLREAEKQFNLRKKIPIINPHFIKRSASPLEEPEEHGTIVLGTLPK